MSYLRESALNLKLWPIYRAALSSIFFGLFSELATDLSPQKIKNMNGYNLNRRLI